MHERLVLGRRAFAIAVLAGLALSSTGCEKLVMAVMDGVLDFVEERTAMTLEEAFPPPGGEMMSGGGG